MYAQMLKETENEETRLFCQIFATGGILIWEPGSPRPPPGDVNDFETRSLP